MRLNLSHEAAIREAAKEYAAAGHKRFDEMLEDFAAYVATDAQSHVLVPEIPWSPYTFFLAEREDGTVVGTLRLRHVLRDRQWQDGGNIGYDVRPSMQGRGYATTMLAQGLREAWRLGLDWVLLTTDPNNRASERVIEKNGGEWIGVALETRYNLWRINHSFPPTL